MRILIVTGYYWPAIEWGGPVRSVRLLARALAEAGEEVEVVTTTTRASASLTPGPRGTREVDRIPVHYFDCVGPRRYFLAPGLPAFLREHMTRFDLVHIQGLFTFLGFAASRIAQRMGVPYVLTPRGMLEPWSLSQKALKKQLYITAIERRTIRGAGCLHFTSEIERSATPRSFRELPAVVVPNCVDISSLASVVREESPSTRELLIWGRIHKMKGFDVLIPAFARALERVPDLRLTIAGPDESGYRAKVTQWVREVGVEHAVRFVGTVDDAARNELFGRVLALVAPSYMESFGMAVAEAMAAGVPVIVSEHVNIGPDLAAHRAGLVVPMDVAQLADALVRVASDTAAAREMGAQGRALTRKLYAPAVVAAGMRELYERVVKSHESSRTA